MKKQKERKLLLLTLTLVNLLLIVPSVTTKPVLARSPWDDNVFLKDIRLAAIATNSTSCWLCIHLPGHSKGGLPLIGLPWERQSWSSFHGSTQTHNLTGAVSLFVTNPAETCFHISQGNGSFLGTYPSCNRTWSGNIQHICSTMMNQLKKKFTGNTIAYQSNSNMSTAEYGMCMDLFSLMTDANYSYPNPVLLPNNVWLLCGSKAYRSVPANWTGTCTFGQVLPWFIKGNDSLQNKSTAHHRVRRDGSLAYDMPWYMVAIRSIYPWFGVGWNAHDIGKLNNWTVAMFNETMGAISLLNTQMGELRTFALHTRFAVDIMLASEGGVCALVGPTCCVYVSNYQANITATIQKMRHLVNDNPIHQYPEHLTFGDIWEAMWSWLPGIGWLKNILTAIFMIIIALICCCCCIQCIPSLISTMKSLMPAVQRNIMVTQKSKSSELTTLLKQPPDFVLTSDEKDTVLSYKIKTEEMWE